MSQPPTFHGRLWLLMLNDMRSSKFEDLTEAARGSCPEELADLVNEERVDPYRDGQWGKSFRRGGPLEWYNPPHGQVGRHLVDLTAHLEQAWINAMSVPSVQSIRSLRESAVCEVIGS